MCGRFSLVRDGTRLLASFPGFTFPDNPPQRYNIAPSLQVLAVPNDGSRAARAFEWGLIPFWAKDPKIGSRMINARCETLAEKPSFREAYKHRRCLIPADGFYEWRKENSGGRKTPMYVRLRSGLAFAFAGLWEFWRAPDGTSRQTCAIITSQPNALMAGIHDRMPVILSVEAYDAWLDPAPRSPGGPDPILVPFPAERMEAHPVSDHVNNPRNDSPECIRPADGPKDTGFLF
ncbi:MAG: SOS response-associated peptidase [Acidobacteriota bacterium]